MSCSLMNKDVLLEEESEKYIFIIMIMYGKEDILLTVYPEKQLFFNLVQLQPLENID